MSNTHGLQQESNVATTASHLKNTPESATSNATASVAPSDVTVKIEKLEGRQRRVFAKLQIPYPVEHVWHVLTDYEAFAEFMPGLIRSRRLDHPTGGVRIEQVRTKNFMGMTLSARSVMDIEETFPHTIHYQLIEGDMKALSGYWQLEPWSLSESTAGTDLMYDFSVTPKPILPMVLVEHLLSHDIPASVLAIRQRVEEIFGSQ